MPPNAESSKSTCTVLLQRKCRIPKMETEIDATQCRVVQVDLHGSTTSQMPNRECRNKVVVTQCRVVQVDFHDSMTGQIPNIENENGTRCHPMPSRPSRLARFYDNANTEYRKWKRKLIPPNAESSKSTYMVLRPHKYRIKNTVIKLLSPNDESSKSTLMTLRQRKYRIPKTKMEPDVNQCRVIQVDFHRLMTAQIPKTKNEKRK